MRGDELVPLLASCPSDSPSLGANPRLATGSAGGPKPRQGEIRDVMVAVLREEGDFLRVAEIYAHVQQRLGRSVGYEHVRDFLETSLAGRETAVRAKGYGMYRLRL